MKAFERQQLKDRLQQRETRLDRMICQDIPLATVVICEVWLRVIFRIAHMLHVDLPSFASNIFNDPGDYGGYFGGETLFLLALLLTFVVPSKPEMGRKTDLDGWKIFPRKVPWLLLSLVMGVVVLFFVSPHKLEEAGPLRLYRILAFAGIVAAVLLARGAVYLAYHQKNEREVQLNATPELRTLVGVMLMLLMILAVHSVFNRLLWGAWGAWEIR